MRCLLFVLALFMPSLVLACEPTSRTGAPEVQVVGITICRSGYQLLYRPEYKTAFWAAEHITADEVRGNSKRDDKFQSDPLVPDHLEAQLSDYFKSGYARGHLAPVGNFRNNPVEAQESFYLTNMIPQWQRCNNGGVWAQIERIVRDWAIHYDELYVVSGPIYWGPPRTIGQGVRVPDALFKVVWNPKLNQTLGFVVPNVELCGTKPKQFVLSTTEVENIAGMSFFPLIRAIPAKGMWQ